MEAEGWNFDKTQTVQLGGKSAGVCDNMYIQSVIGQANVGQMTREFDSKGSAKMTFGNCWNVGEAKAYLNGRVIGTAGAKSFIDVEFDFKVGDTLLLQDEGANSVVQVNSFVINSCSVAGNFVFCF